MSTNNNNNNTPHDPDHVEMSLTTFDKQGRMSLSIQCCSCKMHQPEFIEHMQTIPDGAYVSIYEVPLSIN